MEQSPWLIAKDVSALHDVTNLLPRADGNCVLCDANMKLVCPASCPTGMSCKFVPATCHLCSQAICVTPEPDSSSSGSSDSSGSKSGGSTSSGPSAGPIAGGVIGGIAVIAILTYLVWRFLIKPKRAQHAQQLHQSIYEADASPVRDTEKGMGSRLTHRSSVHTVHSIASTVLTRASNIIQIAYIPGVTNRASPTSPTVLVPPVPPIPMHHTDGGRDSALNDQHFFVPGNLRDSTYSGISNYTDRTSYARTSYAPRSSIASTIYGRQAQIQTPAQTGMRAKPTVVSVKPGASGSTPPMPSIDFDKFNNDPRRKSGASAFSVGSAMVNNANTANMATPARAQVVKVGSGLRQVDIVSKPGSSMSSASFASSSPAELHGESSLPSLRAATEVSLPSSDEQGPFSDRAATGTPTLGAVAEDVSSESWASSSSSRSHSSPERGRSPFSDVHATRN